MTRADIKAGAQRRVLASLRAAPSPAFREFVDTGVAGLGDPITLNEYVDEIVALLSRFSDFLYLPARGTDLVSGQDAYCLPDLKYIEGATVKTSTGIFRDLQLMLPAQLQSAIAAFRDGDATGASVTGDPVYGVIEGGNRIRLYPVPNYSVIAAGSDPKTGLVLRGLGVVNNASWPNETDACPLPARVHSCVVQGVAWRILEPIAPALARTWERQFRYEKGHFESEQATLIEALRSRSPMAFYSGPGAPDNNPLNLW